MAQLSIIIPAYNEEGAIGPVIDALRALPLDAEIMVVDDGSTDKTGEIAAEHGARVIRRPQNSGYGRSVKEGVREASSDTIVVTDADGTYPIEKIPDLVAEFEKGFDMVVGARQGSMYRGSFLKMVSRFFLKAIVEFVVGRRVPDVNSGFRMFRRSTTERYFPDICDGFSFTTTITLVYLLTHKTVSYIPIPYEKRIGRSKVRHIRDALRTLQYITECIVRYNPLKLFVVLSLVALLVGSFAAVGLGFFALLEGFFVALLVFAIGLIAESLRRPRQ